MHISREGCPLPLNVYSLAYSDDGTFLGEDQFVRFKSCEDIPVR